MRRIGEKLAVMLVIGLLFAMAVAAAPDPSGATLTPGESSRGTNPALTSQPAEDGNVTALNIDQNRITEIWQGFYGNVTGTIVLENSNGDNFYDWSASTITGEVYATRNTVPDWSAINCTNSTYWETEESTLNIPSTATDGINETYSSTTHPAFSVGTVAFTSDQCRSARAYNSTGLAGEYYNVLLNSNSTNVVYTSIIADNSDSFDGGTADFEVLVPVDKTTGTATYYIYVELN